MAELSRERLKELKKKVLQEMTHVVCAELGDVSRYLICLKSKGVLDNQDCDHQGSSYYSREDRDNLHNFA